jgi:oligopeptide/dipeptide ABC transporter ATP-binding protein
MALLEIENLKVRYRTRHGEVEAVRGISYVLHAGETLAVIGESGSGKSAHALAIGGLLPNYARTEGSIRFEQRELVDLEPRQWRTLRGNRIGFVFQNPMAALNPVLSIGHQLTDGLRTHQHLDRRQARSRAFELLETVHIPDAGRVLRQYPHQLSGGMQQRVCIAMAVGLRPSLLVADEPTTALDVSVQAGIVELIREMKDAYGMAVLWITHDIALAASFADTMQVMYAGRVLERGPVRDIFRDPRNAYTQALLRALPSNHPPGAEALYTIPGQPPAAYEQVKGDPFAPRNPLATERCFREAPPLQPVPDGAPEHLVAAWYDARLSRQQTAEGDARP